MNAIVAGLCERREHVIEERAHLQVLVLVDVVDARALEGVQVHK